MNHITVIASILAIAVSLAASADKPAQCAGACKDAAKTTVAATAPLSAVYYGAVALKNKRPDIAWSYLKGTLAGILGL